MPEEIIVMNAHLKSAKTADGEQIRLKQTKFLMSQLEKLTDYGKIPTFFCGDFNATPIKAVCDLWVLFVFFCGFLIFRLFVLVACLVCEDSHKIHHK